MAQYRFLLKENIMTSLQSAKEKAQSIRDAAPGIDYYAMDCYNNSQTGKAFDILGVYWPQVLIDLRETDVMVQYLDPQLKAGTDISDEVRKQWIITLSYVADAIDKCNSGCLKTNEMREKLGPPLIALYNKLDERLHWMSGKMKHSTDDDITKEINKNMQACYDGVPAGRTKADVRVEDIFAQYPTNQYGDVISKYAKAAADGVPWTGQA